MDISGQTGQHVTFCETMKAFLRCAWQGSLPGATEFSTGRPRNGWQGCLTTEGIAI